jgi:hypothetical protein
VTCGGLWASEKTEFGATDPCSKEAVYAVKYPAPYAPVVFFACEECAVLCGSSAELVPIDDYWVEEIEKKLLEAGAFKPMEE